MYVAKMDENLNFTVVVTYANINHKLLRPAGPL